jgi:hypothetical protein
VAASERSLPPTAWLEVAVAFGLAALVARWLPGAGGEGAVPPLSVLVTAGALIGAVTTGALFLVLRLDLGLPATTALYAVAFNVLVVLVKFVWGPAGLYEVNRELDLSSELGDPLMATFAAAFVFALYFAAYYAVYRFTKRRLLEQERRGLGGAWVILPLLVVGYLAATGGILGVLLLPLFFAAGGIEYVQFVFSSSYSLAVGLALAAATGLAALAFRDVAAQARLVGDVGLLVSFFWVGLAFLAVYHAVWVVYVIALTVLWPLRVVVPK